MKRAPLVLTATAAGLAATLGFTPHRAATAPAPSTASSGSSRSSGGTTSPSSGKTVTGDAVGTQYGNVQVKVTVSRGRITSIEAVQLPSSDPKSAQISSYAEPLLRQSALSKQDGSVDAVSGATYTSNGYLSALQSALDKAGFPVSSTSSGAA